MQQAAVLVSGAHVVYSRDGDHESQDIWTVRTDGTGDRTLFNAPVQSERLLGVSGPWALVSKWLEDGTSQRWSVRPDTGEQFLLSDEGSFVNDVVMVPQGTERVIPYTSIHLFSVTLRGTNLIDYDRITGDPNSYFIGVNAIADSVVYMIRGEPPTSPPAVLFAKPASGGTRVQFESEQFYTHPAGSIASRLIYQRCSGDFPGLFACDVLSANLDNTGKVVLAGQPANEVVQGVTTNQVIIRRNLVGNDQLVAVPVAGGPEKPLITMTDNEFVDLIVGDLIIVRRQSGTWSLDLNGTLTKLGTIVGDSGFIAVGDSVCVTKVTAVWCMPLDGSGPQVKIADNGKVVGVL
ncbi:MAG: hypothetical protein H7Y39_16480 [Nitrospiraceae bacterium]|nr:hypothetical protein [Nitrospiraceae bacterium]